MGKNKKPIYCSHCSYYYHEGIKHTPRCINKNNLGKEHWYGPSYIKSPKKLNKYNNCAWFMEGSPKKSWDDITYDDYE